MRPWNDTLMLSSVLSKQSLEVCLKQKKTDVKPKLNGVKPFKKQQTKDNLKDESFGTITGHRFMKVSLLG